MISIGFIIASVILFVLIGLVFGVIIRTWGQPTHESYGMLTESAVLRRAFIIFGIPVIIILCVGLYPFERDHHWYTEYTETVISKDTTTLNVNEDNNFRFELTNGIVFKSTDYRFVDVEVGDTITVNCIKNWNYLSADDYDCSLASVSP